MEIHTDRHTSSDRNHTQDRGNRHRSIPAIYHKTKHDSDQDKQQGYHCNGSIRRRRCHIDRTSCLIHGSTEGGSHDRCECRNYQDQGQICEDRKQKLRSLAHIGGDDLTDRLSFVTDGGKERAKVMDAAEEDTTHQDPEDNRNPAKHSRADRSGDGAGSCDGGKVMAHQHRRLSRHIVHTVFHLMCRRRFIALTHTPLFAKPSAVEYVTNDENCNTDD